MTMANQKRLPATAMEKSGKRQRDGVEVQCSQSKRAKLHQVFRDSVLPNGAKEVVSSSVGRLPKK